MPRLARVQRAARKACVPLLLLAISPVAWAQSAASPAASTETRSGETAETAADKPAFSVPEDDAFISGGPTEPPKGPPPGPPPELPPGVLENRPTEPPPGLADPETQRERFAQLYQLLSMSADELTRTRETIEMIEKMSPDQREFLRSRLTRMQEDAPTVRAEIVRYASRLSASERRQAADYWLALRPEERNEERARMDDLQGDALVTYLRQKLAQFTAEQEALRKRMMGDGKGPPRFTPPPPPTSGN